jgi:hypothetical protein
VSDDDDDDDDSSSTVPLLTDRFRRGIPCVQAAPSPYTYFFHDPPMKRV